LKTVLFTFDYELFLGASSGKVKDCILDPTRRLLNLLQRFGFKGIFFVDTTYLIRLKEVAGQYKDAAADLAEINEQLFAAIQQGHYLFPHIHPHWLDAIYLPEQNEWSLENTRYYQFAALPKPEQQDLFEKSIKILQEIAGPGIENLTADAYRAGGWSIQPFKHFKPLFLQYGIKHEWSVIPGKYQFSDAHSFDFRGAPSDEPVYRFFDDPCRKDGNGPFTEWTISSLTMNRYENWINFKVGGLLQRMGKSQALKGKGVSSLIKEEGDRFSERNGKRKIASFEGLNPFTLKKYLSAIRTTGYFQFISHPKLITPYEFTMIEKLFRTLNKKFELQTDFRKAIS
jgi:peptidoglycan/xylan/chitin deacetylase (PgdA/CDA1 family)